MINRNVADQESKAFWDFVDAITQEVKTWPGWKRQALRDTRLHDGDTPRFVPTCVQEEKKGEKRNEN